MELKSIETVVTVLNLQLLLGGVDAEVPEEVAELLGGHEAGLRLVELVEGLHELEDVGLAQLPVAAAHPRRD